MFSGCSAVAFTYHMLVRAVSLSADLDVVLVSDWRKVEPGRFINY